MKRTFAFILLALTVATPIYYATAQEVPVQEGGGVAENSEQLTSCFDHYRFGSVPIVVNSETVRIAQGGELKLMGIVTNENNYPLDDVSVYSKVFYKKNFEKNSFGPDIVDWFVMAEGLDFKAGETKNITYTWNVPADLQPGFYQVGSYVASHDRFNFAGLSFSNDVVGNLFNFSIAGDEQGSVRFDNTQIVLNGNGYHAAIFPPRSDTPVDGVPLTAVVSNTTNTPYEGSVHWTLYSWDGILKEHLISESDASVSVPANGSTTVSYVVKDVDHTVYYIMGELSPLKEGGAKSIISVRYVSPDPEGYDIPRIAFVGANTYPGVKDETLAVACLHSTGSRPSKDVRLELSVQPHDPITWIKNIGSLGKRIYKGDAPGQLSAITVPFKDNSGNFSVTAKLYQRDILIDAVTSNYKCTELGQSCTGKTQWVIVGIVSLLFLTGIGYLIYKFMRRNRRTYAPGSVPPSPSISN